MCSSFSAVEDSPPSSKEATGCLPHALEVMRRPPPRWCRTTLEFVASLETEDPGLLADVAGSGNTDAVRIMLDLGFNVASRTNRGLSKRHRASRHHLALAHATAKLLIERGAPLEVTNKGGKTPLAHAVRGFTHSEWTADSLLETISVLLAAGAQMDSVKPFPYGRRRGRPASANVPYDASLSLDERDT